MKSAILTIALVLTTQAQAQIKAYEGPAAKSANPEYSEVYMSNGRTISDSEAFSEAISGKSVYRCVKQEVAMNKSGKGASLKNIKKNK